MRVLHLNKRYAPHVGGIEKHLQDLARAQAATADVEVDVVVVAEGRAAREIDGKVHVRRLGQLAVLASNPLPVGLTTVLKESYHDVWHFHYPFPSGELALLLAARSRRDRPVAVCTYHSDFVPQSAAKHVLSPLYGELTRRFLREVDGIIVSSPGLAAASRFLRATTDKERVIPFGIDPRPWASTAEVQRDARRLRAAYVGPITLFVGRLVSYKGVEVLLEAFRNVPGTLLLVGEGPLRPRLEAMAADQRLAGRVRFLGALTHPQLVAHLHASDVFALPSVTPNEAFGLVQLEAHACGVPVVSTDLPTGVPFANKHLETGLVVRPGDHVELAGALRLLLEDDALRMRMGTRAQQRQRSEFSLDVMTQRVLEYYDDLRSRRAQAQGDRAPCR
ncbi:MAG: glycosyltransferase [Thermoleophilia bacterium]